MVKFKLCGRKKGERMIKEIIRLHEAGIGTKKIAQMLAISRNTVRKYIKGHVDDGADRVFLNFAHRTVLRDYYNDII